MSNWAVREFKRLFYKLYLEDMTTQEIMTLAMTINQISQQMLREVEENKDEKSLEELNAELDEFTRELRELAEDT